MLVLTAFIWGTAFVAQSVGMDYVGPFTFNAVRCLIGGAVLIPVILILNKNTKTQSLSLIHIYMCIRDSSKAA